MPGAIIAIDQDRPGPSTSVGADGVARKDLWLNHVVRPRSTVGGNSGQEWTLLDKPTGSAASLTNPSSVSCSFTPDLPGTYRLQLVTNAGGAGNVQILVAGVTYDEDGNLAFNGWRVPAFGEKVPENNFGGQTRGWAEALEKIVKDIMTFMTFDTIASKLIVKVVETVNKGTTNGETSTKEGLLKTTNGTTQTLISYPIPQSSMCLYDVVVVAVKDDATIGGFFKRSIPLLRTGVGVTPGTLKNVDSEFIGGAPGWTCTLDDDGSGNARVRVNGNGDTVSWYVIHQSMRVLPVT